jgi:hypothetical protein
MGVEFWPPYPLPSLSTLVTHKFRQLSCVCAVLEAFATDRPLCDLNGFSTTIASNVNDLPATSPHGRYSEHDSRNLGLASGRTTLRGTAMARHDKVAIRHATEWMNLDVEL